MMLSTEERFLATRHMKLPLIIELLDMSEVIYLLKIEKKIDEKLSKDQAYI